MSFDCHVSSRQRETLERVRKGVFIRAHGETCIKHSRRSFLIWVACGQAVWKARSLHAKCLTRHACSLAVVCVCVCAVDERSSGHACHYAGVLLIALLQGRASLPCTDRCVLACGSIWRRGEYNMNCANLWSHLVEPRASEQVDILPPRWLG